MMSEERNGGERSREDERETVRDGDELRAGYLRGRERRGV